MKLCSRKMGRALCFALVFSLLSLIGVASAETDSVTPIQAVEMAKANSIDLQIAKLELDNARIAHQKALANSQTPIQAATANAAWESAQEAYRSADTNVALDALSAYVAVQEATFTLGTAEKSASLAAQSLEKTRLLVSKGTAGNIEQLQAEKSNMSALNSLAGAQNSYAAAKIEFQELVGAEVLPVVTAAPLFKTPEITISLDDAIAAALANSPSIKSLENALATAQLNRELDLATETSPLDDQKSQNDLQLAQLRLQSAKADLVKSVTAQYNSLVQAKESLVIAAASLEIATKQFEITKKQVEAGIKTASDLATAEITFVGAQSSYRNSLGLGSSGYAGKWIALQKTLGNEIDLSEVLSDAD